MSCGGKLKDWGGPATQKETAALGGESQKSGDMDRSAVQHLLQPRTCSRDCCRSLREGRGWAASSSDGWHEAEKSYWGRKGSRNLKPGTWNQKVLGEIEAGPSTPHSILTDSGGRVGCHAFYLKVEVLIEMEVFSTPSQFLFIGVDSVRKNLLPSNQKVSRVS